MLSITPAGESTSRRILRVRDALDNNYARRWNAEQLARIACVSPTHLRRLFRAAFGETPHAYLRRRRIERACHLLRSSQMAVTDIARAVGYESLGTFTRTFACVMGETPVDHRNRGRLPSLPGCVIREVSRRRDT